MKDKVISHGEVEYILERKSGEVIRGRCPNTVVNEGLASIAGCLVSDVSVDEFDYMAIGTGTTAVAAADTALETEITTGGGARAGTTGIREDTNVTNDTAKWSHAWTFTSSFTLTEAGLFNAPYVGYGQMLARAVMSAALSVSSGDKLTLHWRIYFA